MREEALTAVTIWAVRVGDELYSRSAPANARRYRAAERRHEVRIEAGETAVDVAFEDAPHHLDQETTPPTRRSTVPSSSVDSATTEARRRPRSDRPPLTRPPDRLHRPTSKEAT